MNLAQETIARKIGVFKAPETSLLSTIHVKELMCGATAPRKDGIHGVYHEVGYIKAQEGGIKRVA